jgi:hypothetical protein
MIRLTLFTSIFLLLSGCNLEEKEEIQTTTSADFTKNITQQEQPLACSTANIVDFSDHIVTLNQISQQMFATDTVDAVNGYANLFSLSQLALTSRGHTASLVELLGLTGLTEYNVWFELF